MTGHYLVLGPGEGPPAEDLPEHRIGLLHLLQAEPQHQPQRPRGRVLQGTLLPTREGRDPPGIPSGSWVEGPEEIYAPLHGALV